MPVSRSYIATFANTDANQFQALTDLANFSDALESALGVRIGGSGNTGAPAPAPASWTIVAGNGHFLIQITNPAASGIQPAIQHQISSSVSPTFDTAAGVTTFTLGQGEATRDIVDPNVTKYWRLQSRYPGSAWNGWRLYVTSAGVVALASGDLKTS